MAITSVSFRFLANASGIAASFNRAEEVATLPPEDKRDLHTLYMVPPSDAGRDSVLSDFLDGWTNLERTLLKLFHYLVETDLAACRIVFGHMNLQAQRDLILSLAGLRFPSDHPLCKSIAAQMERVKKLATKRNRIIHGYWCAHYDVTVKDGFPVAENGIWVRQYEPSNPAIAQQANDRENVKQYNSYHWTIADIRTVRKSTDALCDDIIEYLKQLRPPPPRPGDPGPAPEGIILPVSEKAGPPASGNRPTTPTPPERLDPATPK